MIENISLLVVNIVESLGYLGIFSVMTLNSNFIPIHSEILLPLSGYLVSQGKFAFSLVLVASILGDLFGSLIGYFIGKILEEKVILKSINKYGKYILLKEKDYLKIINWFRKYGGIVVFLAKLSPGLKSISSVAAGVAEIKLRTFLISVFLASFIYNFVLIYTGFYLGNNWINVATFIQKVEIFIFVIILIGVLWFINLKFKIVRLPKRKH